jgi:GrpB-like predicted nucleotidyltransferase (UPF0157 family)
MIKSGPAGARRRIGKSALAQSRRLESPAVDHAVPVVEVVAYDPAWPGLFEAERRILAKALPRAVSVEHVGSTSVLGLAAKPIIDIVVVVPKIADVVADVTPVEQLGYEYRPRVFAGDPDHEFFVKDTDGRRTHHLHVFDAASPRPQANRVFRDYLATHPDAARRYAAAKRQAAAAHPDSRARYGNAKEAVTREVLAEAVVWGRATGQLP